MLLLRVQQSLLRRSNLIRRSYANAAQQPIIDADQVRGKDGVGAKMDSMELEREKGITIQSAATYCHWRGININIIDTPGHVDFTIEVERALRVLDSAILVLCGVSGVQSQTMTVDRQMRRYQIPRLAFINKLDRMGANPWMVIDRMRSKLKHNAAALQIPIGQESELRGLVDLITQTAHFFTGPNGSIIETGPIPAEHESLAQTKRKELIQALANVDEQVGECYLLEQEPDVQLLHDAIRRTCLARTFIPVLMGAAYKNVGVQLLLDAVGLYLPRPHEVHNEALAVNSAEEERVSLQCSSDLPFVGLAFKLEEGKFGQLTYLRIYQGRLTRGATIYNINQGKKKVKVPRLVRMHANEMEDVESVGAGEICAMFGVECSSGDTFTDGNMAVTLQSMHVPDPVISLAIKPTKSTDTGNFGKALARFQREDPTFRLHTDPDSGETIISGMGELHLEIYVERLKREYGVESQVGKPRVAFRETITKAKTPFNYTHKKQTGGAGQFARVAGHLEPIQMGETVVFNNEFESRVVGGTVPTEFLPACEKGFLDGCQRGPLTGHPMVGVKMIIDDGTAHVVDSNEHAFRTAASQAFRQACLQAQPIVLEPIMRVTITIPQEFQGAAMASINRRMGIIVDTEGQDEIAIIQADVPLNSMFGYSTELRSLTQGKGEFAMEYRTHQPVPGNLQAEMVTAYQKSQKSMKD